MMDPDTRQQLEADGKARRERAQAAIDELRSFIDEHNAEARRLELAANKIAERAGIKLPYAQPITFMPGVR
jgi:ribosomal protein L31E